jgi:WD repeat-containing protein 35
MPDEDKQLTFLKGDVHLLITEWVPFGENNMVSLQEKLEASEKVKDFLLTDRIDTAPETATFMVGPPLTMIRLIDHKMAKHVDFEAEVKYPESGGDIQEEQFGVHVDVSGSVTYGLELWETDGQSETHSMDNISKIIADLVYDSSKMMDTLLSNNQKRLLDLVYMGHSRNRDKFTVITAKEMVPDVSVKDLMARTDYEAEINQVMNSVIATHDFGDGKIVIGESGALLISDNYKRYEGAMTLYSLFRSLEMFIMNTHSRFWMASDTMKELKTKILHEETESVAEVMEEITELSADVSMFKAILGYIKESLLGLDKALNMAEGETGKAFVGLLELSETLEDMKARITDASMVIENLNTEVQNLMDLSSTVNEKEMKGVFEALNENTAHNVAIGEALELLEAGIFGVYLIELLHISILFSGREHDLMHHHFLYLPYAFWIVVLGGVLGVYFGWTLLQRMKRKSIKEFKEKMANRKDVEKKKRASKRKKRFKAR